MGISDLGNQANAKKKIYDQVSNRTWVQKSLSPASVEAQIHAYGPSHHGFDSQLSEKSFKRKEFLFDI